MANINTKDEVSIKNAYHERFSELADQWENEAVLLSRTDLATEHPAYKKIVDMSEPVVPLILQKNEIARWPLVRRSTRDH